MPADLFGHEPPAKGRRTSSRAAAAATAADREAARVSAAAIRASLADPALAGERIVSFVTMARPRRHLRLVSWSGLPGLTRWGKDYLHDLLPGWSYTGAEMRSEMLEDLDRLAATGERPEVPTR